MANDTAPTRQLSFASPSSSDRVTYSLLTLPPALAALLAEEASDSPLEIRGNATDAAVLVTKDRTYTLRGVQNSNSLCLCSSGTAGDEGRGWFAGGDVDDYSNMKTDKDSKTIEIETVLHETLEVAPTVARTERLETLLRGTEYAGDDSPLTTRLTLDALRSELPASDAEILSSLRTHRAIRLPQPSSPDSGSGEQVDLIRRVPPSYMLKVLPVLLSALDDARAVVRDEGGGESLAAAEAAAAAQKEKAEALRRALNGSKLKKPLTKGKEKEKEKEKSAATAGMDTLTPLELELDAEVDDLLTAWDAVDCGESAAHALLSWFVAPLPGDGGRVRVRVHDVVRELGMSTMEAGGHAAQRLDAFMTKWTTLTGERFKHLCALPLLSGNHITQLHPAPATITYISPTRLSPDPATRFSELFSLKPRWAEKDMLQFLSPHEISGGDVKKRDAIVLKFVRKVKEKDGGVTWTARNLW